MARFDVSFCAKRNVSSVSGTFNEIDVLLRFLSIVWYSLITNDILFAKDVSVSSLVGRRVSFLRSYVTVLKTVSDQHYVHRIDLRLRVTSVLVLVAYVTFSADWFHLSFYSAIRAALIFYQLVIDEHKSQKRKYFINKSRMTVCKLW